MSRSDRSACKRRSNDALVNRVAANEKLIRLHVFDRSADRRPMARRLAEKSSNGSSRNVFRCQPRGGAALRADTTAMSPRNESNQRRRVEIVFSVLRPTLNCPQEKRRSSPQSRNNSVQGQASIRKKLHGVYSNQTGATCLARGGCGGCGRIVQTEFLKCYQYVRAVAAAGR
jgi:hypothetical protein